MMATCAICRKPTDLALTDVLTDEQIRQLGGVDKIPLIGTCGDDKCVGAQRLNLALSRV